MQVVVLDDYQRRAADFAAWESLGGGGRVRARPRRRRRAGRGPRGRRRGGRDAGADAVRRRPARAAARPAAAGHHRCRERLDRRRSRAAARHHGLRHPQPARPGRGADLGADPRPAPPAARGRGGHPGRRLAEHHRVRPGRPDPRAGRPRPARQPGGPGRTGLRDGGPGLVAEPRPRGSPGPGRDAGVPGRAARPLRRGVPAPEAQRPHPRNHRARSSCARCARRRTSSTPPADRSSTRTPCWPHCTADGSPGAALDVYDEEPLPEDHPLRWAPRTLLTPHLGYVTEGGYRLFYGDAVDDIRAWLDGTPVRVVQP